jgi:uncharacterized protein YndB with AHSA1/START domain
MMASCGVAVPLASICRRRPVGGRCLLLARIDYAGSERDMPIHYQHVETVATSPERVFEVIDDLPLTARWLPPCVSLAKVGDGPNAPGDKLRYVFKQGGRQSEMEGVILDRVPGERLHCKYSDRAFDVWVDLRVAAAPQGALTTHIIEILPKTVLGKLMWPLIRLGLGKQTRDAATNLKKLVETGTA